MQRHLVINDSFQRYTRKAANRILPSIIKVTNDAIEALNAATMRFGSEELDGTDLEFEDRAQFQSEVETILDSWSRQVVRLGAYPKGYFTVDFKTYRPDELYCWTYGEAGITHSHKIWESFQDRRPIDESMSRAIDDFMN